MKQENKPKELFCIVHKNKLTNEIGKCKLPLKTKEIVDRVSLLMDTIYTEYEHTVEEIKINNGSNI